MNKVKNPLLRTDVYKMGHMEQYRPGVTKVYSHLVMRSKKTYTHTLWFGLQYYLNEYLAVQLEPWMAEDFIEKAEKILGRIPSGEVQRKIRALAKLGYFPLKIKSIEEGSIVENGNVLMTITNTHPEFAWVVGFVESLLLKVWYPCVVATTSLAYRQLVTSFWNETVDSADMGGLPFAVHDFGYRGDTSEEGAALSGAAHLTCFTGSDTVPAIEFIENYYGTGGYDPPSPMSSVPASEHSVMCSFGRENELAAFEHMLDLYPTGIVSIVSDTFNVYDVVTDFAERLKDRILARDGKVVFRPDSGNPENVICGDPLAPEGSREQKGVLLLLAEKFGTMVNEKGYKVLNPKVGLIYGDGMYLSRFRRTLQRMKDMGFAASNLVIGVGGILRNHSRDTLGAAIKATYVEVNGEGIAIEKDPITDPGKKSLKGLLALFPARAPFPYGYRTHDQQSEFDEDCDESMLGTVFLDGTAPIFSDIDDVRERRAGEVVSYGENLGPVYTYPDGIRYYSSAANQVA